MRQSRAYRRARALPKTIAKTSNPERRKVFQAIRAAHAFSVNEIERFATGCRTACWIGDHIGSHDGQKLAARAFTAVERHAFGRGGRPRFKRRGELKSIDSSGVVHRDLYSAFLARFCSETSFDARQAALAWPGADTLLRRAASKIDNQQAAAVLPPPRAAGHFPVALGAGCPSKSITQPTRPAMPVGAVKTVSESAGESIGPIGRTPGLQPEGVSESVRSIASRP